MNLLTATEQIVLQINELLIQINKTEYSKQLSILNNGSIGQHVRHITEFYDCLLKDYNNNTCDYDSRSRLPKLENDPLYTNDFLKKKLEEIQQINLKKEINLLAIYSPDDKIKDEIKTSIERELIYCLEHAIHHMAIIKIALNTDFPHINVDENFGIAPSTLKYRQQCAQ